MQHRKINGYKTFYAFVSIGIVVMCLSIFLLHFSFFPSFLLIHNFFRLTSEINITVTLINKIIIWEIH